MAVMQIVVNERVELLAENRRLREENARLRQENDRLRATASVAALRQAPRAAAPVVAAAAPAPTRPTISVLAPRAIEPVADLDDAVTRFSLLEFDE